MTSPNVSLEQLEVVRAPGFERAGFKIPDLVPGVNVIYGPNASGKSTLARALSRLMSPTDRTAGHETLSGLLSVDGQVLRLTYDSGHASCQQGGVEVDYPALAANGMADRYVLALHDLIHAEDGREFAAELVRVSAGGYDVPAAAKTLGFRGKERSKGGEFKAFRNAQTQWREASQKQQSLADQQRGLAELEQRRDSAQKAERELQWLQKAEECNVKRHEVALAEKLFDAYPSEMKFMTGDELQRLDDLRKEAEAARQQRDADAKKIRAANDLLASSPLPDEGIDQHEVNALREESQQLRVLDSQVENRLQEVASAAAERDRTRETIGLSSSVDQAEQLSPSTVRDLMGFAQRAETVRAEAATKEALQKWLGEESADECDAERLSHAISIMHQWLASRHTIVAPEATRSRLPGALAIALICLSLIMTIAVHWSWLLVLPLAGAIAAWVFWPRNNAVSTDPSDVLREQFTNLDVASPPEWAEQSVRSHLQVLAQRYASAVVDREKITQWGDLADRCRTLADDQKVIDEQREGWIGRLGFDPASEEGSLVYLAQGLHQYQKVAAKYVAEQQGLEETRRQYDQLLRAVSDRVRDYGVTVASDPARLGAAVEQLASLNQEHCGALKVVADTVQAAMDANVARIDQQIAKLYTDRGLTADQEDTLRRWHRDLDDYRGAVKAKDTAEHDLNSAQSHLADHPDLCELSLDQIQQRRATCEGQAAAVEELREQVISLQTHISHAKERHDVEAALVARDSAADTLRRSRSKDQDAMVGNVLAQHLASDQQEHEQLPVFRRAKELFVRVTNGRYQLVLDAGSSPNFRALDTSAGVGRNLSELSSGTRLQLLLAVRIAFIERQERGRKLPLVFDETLANSDEQRAQAMIQAVIQIARDGRQIFYLTAQHDEVAKWRRTMQLAEDVPLCEVDLAEIRGFSEADRVPVVDYDPPPTPEIPSPDGDNWQEYGGRLHDLPGIDPRGDVGGVHLWYVLDDVAILYDLLRRGINRWGQLQSLVEYRATAVVSKDSTAYVRAVAAAGAIHETMQQWRIGRGRSVDRHVATESGAVSEKFIEPVSELIDRTGGDAQALLDLLTAGEVSGFRKAKCAELQEFLTQEGYLDSRQRLTADEILYNLRIVVFADLAADRLSSEMLGRCVGWITGAALSDNSLAAQP